MVLLLKFIILYFRGTANYTFKVTIENCNSVLTDNYGIVNTKYILFAC
jgi:hypothetical protein